MSSLEEVKENENPRANMTARKYKKQIDWRRFKVRELLIREHSQYEISHTLHISQPTVSRDIDFIHKQYELNPDNYSNNLVTEYVKISLSVEEILQKLWKIVDDNRICVKDRLRAISMLKEYYDFKVEILTSAPIIKKMKEHLDQVKIRDDDLTAKEIDLASRERILDSFMKVHNITKKDLDDSHISAI